MTNTRRKNRWRAKQDRLAATAPTAPPPPHPRRPMFRSLGLPASAPATAASVTCTPVPPPLDNFVLRHAAAGRLSIGDPTHRPPAPLDF